MLYNRDLSWLGFNYRVLQEAANSTVPLFERLKFLSIFSSNLDEFFRVRYPLLFAFSKLSHKTKQQVSSANIEELPDTIQTEINRQLNVFGSILTTELIPLLKENGIIFYYNTPILAEHLGEIKEIFLSKLLSFIQPLYLESEIGKAFMPENNQLYMVVTLREPEHANFKHAIINIPSDKLSRFFVLTPLNNFQYVIFIDDMIRENLDCLFPGFEISGVYSVKFNRDSELHMDEEYSGDLLVKIEKQLKKRDFGPPSRFLYEGGMPRNIQLFMAASFGIQFEEMFAGSRYHHLSDLSSFPTFNKNLTYEKRKPLWASTLMACGDIFNILDQQDVLLHIPYQSYNPVLSFFNQAAVDINVIEIFITLYRVAAESHIVNALISAAKNGKKVTAFIELKARFDEANNIKWGRKMKDAGIKIIYSIPHIKVHSKIALIQKKSGADILSYAILSTGNFNEVTAQFYTDHLLMTTDFVIVKELLQLFRFLQKTDKDLLNNKLKFNTLFVSQFNMIDRFEKLIEQEIQKAASGEAAEIRIKINNLEEPHMISLLYKASQAGVTIKLCVRSICCLIPQMPGLSDHIIVKRLVDRYLEHTRIFIFGTGDHAEVIMGSSDWMTRNLYHRIEVCVPIKNNTCRQELIDYFQMQWRDNDKADVLTSAMEQHPVVNEPGVYNAQSAIYQYLQNRI